MTCIGEGAPEASRVARLAQLMSSCVPMSAELGKAGLCIKARCEKKGARAIVILTELGICTALLEEETPSGRHLV